MKPVATLAEVRAKIAAPEHWTQGCDARDAKGREVSATDKRARCWCIKGAFVAVGSHSTDKAWSYFMQVAPPGPLGVILWNDAPGRKHEEVLQLVDAAIAHAEQEEARASATSPVSP